MTAALARDYGDAGEWVPFSQAADEFGVTTSTLARWARAGKITRLYHGGRVFTTRSSMAEYRAQHVKEAEARRLALQRASKARRKR